MDSTRDEPFHENEIYNGLFLKIINNTVNMALFDGNYHAVVSLPDRVR